jgi:carbonic anhydrase
MRKSLISAAVLAICVLAIWGLAVSAGPAPAVSPERAIERLTAGNLRFVEGRSVHPNGDAARREQTAAAGQHPSATILSCSDSRAPLEVVFDQGIGDIFAVRVAGNVCGSDVMGSIEYGVDHVGTPLLVVLGHSQCGAVKAAVSEAHLHGHIEPLVARIAPAVARAKASHPDLHGMELLPAATEANVWNSIEELFAKSEITRHCVESGKLKIIGAIYDVKSGRVRWLGEHPRQGELLKKKP